MPLHFVNRDNLFNVISLRRHVSSSLAHAGYLDLLASLKDKAAAELRGTPTRVERNKKFTGTTPSASAPTFARRISVRIATKSAPASRARRIRILRAEGFMGVDAATRALLNAFATPAFFGFSC
jgi:hypothetical protein